MPSTPLRRRQSDIPDYESRRQGCVFGLEFRRQGCVFDFDSDVIEDTICGVPDLPSAYQGPAQTQVRNFSLPSYCDSHTPMRHDPHVALVCGNENHNRNSPGVKDQPPVPKDRAVDESSRRKCLSPFVYRGPDNELCRIPAIVLTEGEDDLTHISQLQKKLQARPLGMFPPSISELHDIVIAVRVPNTAFDSKDFICR